MTVIDLNLNDIHDAIQASKQEQLRGECPDCTCVVNILNKGHEGAVEFPVESAGCPHHCNHHIEEHSGEMTCRWCDAVWGIPEGEEQ